MMKFLTDVHPFRVTLLLKKRQDLANVLKAGKLPAPARIVQEEIVGPSLGKESINAGLISFIIAFILVLLYMQFYYAKAGLVANVALLANVFFLIGVLASVGAVLTLPGIAGIVLTLGMAVDANVIIYERIKEELRAGKGLRLLFTMVSIMHIQLLSTVTLLLSLQVLYFIFSVQVQSRVLQPHLSLVFLLHSSQQSLFRAWFSNQCLTEMLNITFGNKYTINAFTKVNINFIGIRKKLYIVSGVVILIGMISLATKGLNFGVDFAGGRSYIVKFDQDVNSPDIRKALTANAFGEAPEVKTIGVNKDRVKITTKFMVDDKSEKADSIVENKLYTGLEKFL